MRAQEFLPTKREFILYVNDKPAVKYQSEADALRDMDHLRRKNPQTKLELKHEVCGIETLRSINEYKINNKDGIGSVPYNQEVDYFGLRVAMRPSTFLKLALPMNNSKQDQDSIEHIVQQKDTEGIGAPFLNIKIPQSWEDGDLKEPARIIGHDGRHRMAAILKSEGDDPVETHLFPQYLRNRDFDAHPEWLQQLNKVIIGQRGNTIQGPIFLESVMNEALVSYLDAMDDFSAKHSNRPGTTKRLAEAYLGRGTEDELTHADLKRLRAKTNKMKKSDSKAERQRGINLSRQASWYTNFHK